MLDFHDLPVHSPASVAEVGEIIREANQNDSAIYPCGGRTMLDIGLTPTRKGSLVDLRRLDQVLDYPARDMTITVQAGITIAKLRSILQKENQQLPVDIPLPDQATLGGAIAVNASGSRRFGLGTLRDYIIGISVVNDEGTEIKGGGRVVKNVAGYDLMKLFTGSFGTLGIISQVTLKVKPSAESTRWVWCGISASQTHDILELLHRTKTRPTAIDLLNRSAQEAAFGKTIGDRALVLCLEDNAVAVTWQVDQLKKELPSELHEVSPDHVESFTARLRDFWVCPAWEGKTLAEPGGSRKSEALPLQNHTTLKATMVPSFLTRFLDVVDRSTLNPYVLTHAGNGIVIIHYATPTSVQEVAKEVESLSAIAAEGRGNLTVPRCPREWKTLLPVWGRSMGERGLARLIKHQLDPKGRFNPGRWLDGI